MAAPTKFRLHQALSLGRFIPRDIEIARGFLGVSAGTST
jgi:hypothetical protein